MENNKWDKNFFSKRKHIAWRAKPVCDQIIAQFNPKSVIDVGCGIGEFLEEFKDRGIKITGTENTREVYPYLMIPLEDLIIMDITATPPSCSNFDIALCFMVIGRLPENTWDHCAEFLAACSDTIITVVENEWLWGTKMKQVGFVENTMETVLFRQALRPLMNKTAMRSFQHTQIFRRKS
jgi:SAM-dependent methyltransferase